MNPIILNNTLLPIVSSCDSLAAAEAFYHADRITDFHVMIYVTEGCIYVTEDTTDYALRPGELLFLKSGIRHFGKTEIAKGTRWHYVHFYMEGLSEPKGNRPVFVTGNTVHLSEFCPKPMELTLPKTLAGLSGSELEKQITSFTDYFHSTDPKKDWNLNQRFFQLLTEIAQYNKNTENSLSLADKIAQYLTAHYTEAFSAAVLEQQFFLSYKYMAAVFKKEKQQTMQQYHTQVRMNIACKLLRSTLLPIGEVSQQVGYPDMLYFSRCFHTIIGMSPTEYRRQPHTY